MKVIKRNLAILLAACLVITSVVPAFAAPLSHTKPVAVEDGTEKVTGTWDKDAAGNWHFNSKERNAKDGWYYLNTTNKATDYNWFHFTNGVMSTGWVQDKTNPSVWYYTGEIKDNSEGGLVRGWATDSRDGKKYYMDPVTGIMSYGWKQIAGVWYYFGEKQYENAAHPFGAMYVNEMTPDGYYVGSTGAWQQNTSSGSSSGGSRVKKYAIRVTAQDDHGTVIAEVNGEKATMAERGEEVVLTAIPDVDYAFDKWEVVFGNVDITGKEADDTLSIVMPASDIVLMACFDYYDSPEYYSINISTVFNHESSGTAIAYVGDEKVTQSLLQGTKVTLIASPSDGTSTFSGWKFEGEETTHSNATYEFEMPGYDVNVTATFDKKEECLAAGTMITMADGTKKPVEALGVGDMIKAFDHTAGKLTDAKIIDYWHYPEPKSGLMTLHFTNGINIGIVTAHSFFCIEDNTYVYIDEKNVKEYIGKHFYNAETGASEELLSVTSGDEKVETFYLATEEHFNCVAEGLLNLEDGIYLAVYSCFEYDENKVINRNKLAEDIKEYGLFTYEDFSYMTEEEFINHKLEYLKIVLGKGVISESDLQLLKTLYFSDEYNIDIQ